MFKYRTALDYLLKRSAHGRHLCFKGRYFCRNTKISRVRLSNTKISVFERLSLRSKMCDFKDFISKTGFEKSKESLVGGEKPLMFEAVDQSECYVLSCDLQIALLPKLNIVGSKKCMDIRLQEKEGSLSGSAVK